MAENPKDEQLYWAAFRGNLEEVKSLCSDPAVNVNWQSENGYTAFSCACLNGHSLVVEHLLAHTKIDPNLSNYEGTTPLFLACQNGHKEVVSMMLADPRVDPNKPDDDQSTPLWMACQEGYLAVVQLLLASGREIDTKMRSTHKNRTAAEQGRPMGERDEDDETEEDFQRSKIFGPKCAELIDEYEESRWSENQTAKRTSWPSWFVHFSISLDSPVLIHRFDSSALKKITPCSNPRREISLS